MPAEPTVHTTMAELISRWPGTRKVLASRGMACVGCAMASFETLGEAAVAYGFEPRQLLRDLLEIVRAPKPRGARR